MAAGTRADTGDPRFIADLSWTEAAAALHPAAIVLLPVGAIEAHGPHLPLDTDVVIAATAAWRGAQRLAAAGEDVLVAPPVVYGTSYVGACFPGTTPLPPEVVTSTVAAVLTGFARSGPRRLCLVNAHLEPAHVTALTLAVGDAARESGSRIAFPDKRDDRWAALLSDEFRRGMRHAGAYETSLMLAAAPERVRRELLLDLPPVLIDLPARLRAGATTFFEAGGTEGYFGDPASATAEEGERLFSVLAGMIATAVAELGPPDSGE